MHQGVAPNPDQVTDLAEFIEALRSLRLWAGGPSYRVLAKRVGPLLRPPQTIAHTTVTEVFQPHRRRLDLDLVVAIVRALGVQDHAVERWRSACVRVHVAAKSGGQVGVFHQLPPAPTTFTGREAALKQLVDAATAPAEGRARTVVVAAIEGTAGVGKTQLALRAAHDLIRAGQFADMQLYVNLRGFDSEMAPSDPGQVLSAFLRQLGIAPSAIPTALDERAAMFRDQLHDRRALVLLDNAADEEQIRPLIPGGAHNLALVTSRRHLSGWEGAEVVVLDVFTAAEGVALLTRIVGASRVEAEPAAAQEIVELCGRLPLAVAMAASRLRARPAWALSDLVRRIRADRISGLGDGARSPWPVFELSYRGLTEPDRNLFRLLALHPGRDATAESSAALAGCEVAQAQERLESLVDEHLLQQKSADRYEFHDLLRVYAQHKVAAEVPDPERAAAVERVLRWYAATANAAANALDAGYTDAFPADQARGPRRNFDGPTAATAWFRLELANMSAAVEQAHERRFGFASSWITAAMPRFLLRERREKELIALRRIGLAGARQIHSRRGEANALMHIAEAEHKLGNRDAAEEACIESLAIYRDLGDRVQQARVMALYAFTLLGRGRVEQAFDMAHQAVDMLRPTGGSIEIITALNDLAACLHALHRPDEALDLLIEAREVAEAVDDPFRISVINRNIGFTCLVLRRYEQAEAAFDAASKGFGKAADDFNHIESLHGLARAQYGQGRRDVARHTIANASAKLARLDTATATRFRHGLESSPVRYDESADIDPAATAMN